MPLHDNYESDKVLASLTKELLPEITVYLDSFEENRYGFVIMIMDKKEALMRYASDIDRRDAVLVVKGWLKKQEDQIAIDKLTGKLDDPAIN